MEHCFLIKGYNILPEKELYLKVAAALGNAKAPCSCIVFAWAFKGLQYHNFGVCVKLHDMEPLA